MTSGKHLDPVSQRKKQRECMTRLRATRRREMEMAEAEYQRQQGLRAIAPELFPTSTALYCVQAGQLYGY